MCSSDLTHVFDLATLAGGEIHIRRAKADEPFLPLGSDAKEVKLTANDLVADDAESKDPVTRRAESRSSHPSWAQQMAQGLAKRMATRFSPKMAPRFQAWRRMLPPWMVVKAPSMPWSRLKWRKPSDRMQGALVVGLALMALSTVLTFWMQPESFKSVASGSSKPTRAAVSNPATTGMRPVALRMDAQ